jgi:hypothetical protein
MLKYCATCSLCRLGTTKRGQEKLFSPVYPQILWKMVFTIGADFAIRRPKYEFQISSLQAVGEIVQTTLAF